MVRGATATPKRAIRFVIYTQSYRDRVERRFRRTKDAGLWEGAILYQYLYDAKGNARFIPILLGDELETSIPVPLRGQTRYRIKAFDLGDGNFPRCIAN